MKTLDNCRIIRRALWLGIGKPKQRSNDQCEGYVTESNEEPFMACKRCRYLKNWEAGQGVNKYENNGITAIVTEDKFKIEIPITGLVSGFEHSPDNFNEMTVKHGKQQLFADYIAKKVIDDADPETGDSLVAKMFDAAFDDIFEGNDYMPDLINDPEECEEEE